MPLYTGRAGVAEIIDVGQVDPSDSAGVANRLAQLLENETVWLRVAQMQLEAINDYREAEYESEVLNAWEGLTSPAPATPLR